MYLAREAVKDTLKRVFWAAVNCLLVFLASEWGLFLVTLRRFAIWLLCKFIEFQRNGPVLRPPGTMQYDVRAIHIAIEMILVSNSSTLFIARIKINMLIRYERLVI